jgi:hypothetical protein
MSQVTFTTQFNGNPVTVTGGWDVQLQYYYFTIEYVAPDFDSDIDSGFDSDEVSEGGMLYSNLDTEAPFKKDNKEYKEQLRIFGIEAPPGFWEMIERNEGNVLVEYRIETGGVHNWHRQEW